MLIIFNVCVQRPLAEDGRGAKAEAGPTAGAALRKQQTAEERRGYTLYGCISHEREPGAGRLEE